MRARPAARLVARPRRLGMVKAQRLAWVRVVPETRSRELIVALCIVAGTGNPNLAEAVAAGVGSVAMRVGLERFPDGELCPVVGPMRGDDVYVLQPTAPPVNEHLMELALLVDACRRAGAGAGDRRGAVLRLRPPGSPKPPGPSDRRTGGRRHLGDGGCRSHRRRRSSHARVRGDVFGPGGGAHCHVGARHCPQRP